MGCGHILHKVIFKFNYIKVQYKNFYYFKQIFERNEPFLVNLKNVETLKKKKCVSFSRTTSSLFNKFLIEKFKKSLIFYKIFNKLHYTCVYFLLELPFEYTNYYSRENGLVSFPSYQGFYNVQYYSKQKEMAHPKDEIEEHWGGPEAFKLILFLKDDFEDQLKKHESILIFFSASWCHHCRQLRKPYGMAALMSKEANLRTVFATYDINHNPDFAQEKGVVGIPLIKYYKNGNFITNYKGKRTSDELFDFAKNPPVSTIKADKIEF